MKKETKNNVQMMAVGLVVACLCIVFIYGAYWITKTVSYTIFYEDMVKQTVAEMVDAKYLNIKN